MPPARRTLNAPPAMTGKIAHILPVDKMPAKHKRIRHVPAITMKDFTFRESFRNRLGIYFCDLGVDTHILRFRPIFCAAPGLGQQSPRLGLFIDPIH